MLQCTTVEVADRKPHVERKTRTKDGNRLELWIETDVVSALRRFVRECDNGSSGSYKLQLGNVVLASATVLTNEIRARYYRSRIYWAAGVTKIDVKHLSKLHKILEYRDPLGKDH